MYVDNELFKALRKYKGLTLTDASESICSSSALSQFETNKINLSEDNKLKILKRYGVSFVPHSADLSYMRDKIETLRNYVRYFYVPSCQKVYEIIIRREGYLYYDMNLLIDSFNLLASYEILNHTAVETGIKRVQLLGSLEHLMTHSQKKEYYFNIALVHLFKNKSLKEVELAFEQSMHYMNDTIDEFILFWYSYAMKYFGKKMLSIKHYQEVERHFMVNNNFLGIQNVLLELAELFMIVEEYKIASDYLDKYSEKRQVQKTTYAINDELFHMISGQLAFVQKKYKRALSQYQAALKTTEDYYIQNDIEDYIHVSMLEVYKLTDDEKYHTLLNQLTQSLDLKQPRYFTAYYLKNEASEKKYEDYINKVVIPNEYHISNRNYSMILLRYRQYLTTKKKYSALSKIILP